MIMILPAFQSKRTPHPKPLHGCFCNWGSRFAGVLITRVLSFGVCIGSNLFWKLPHTLIESLLLQPAVALQRQEHMGAVFGPGGEYPVPDRLSEREQPMRSDRQGVQESLDKARGKLETQLLPCASCSWQWPFHMFDVAMNSLCLSLVLRWEQGC